MRTRKRQFGNNTAINNPARTALLRIVRKSAVRAGSVLPYIYRVSAGKAVKRFKGRRITDCGLRIVET